MSKDYSHRLGKKTIRVLKKDGSPVVGKAVNFEMQNHEFLWGSGIREAIAYSNNTLEGAEKEKAWERIEIWLKLCNATTLPFYWGGFEREEGKPMTRETMNAAKFLQDRGIVLKGHPLCWHTVCAPWLMKYSNEEILRRQLARIRRDVSYFEGVVDMWDVINEVVIMPIFDKYDNAITRVCKQIGRVQMIKEVFAAARETNPNATLLLNDFNVSTNYEILIDGCLNSGVPIDVIGIQSHQHQGYWGSEKLYEVLARFDHFGLPLHFTENTLTSGHIMPPEIDDLNDYKITEWPSTPEFEDRQARETAEMYEILFAHPLVDSAVSWGFVDGGWLGAPSGLIRADNSIKPVYERLMELIKGEWWTIGEAITDENGEVVIEGYRGDYKLSCCDNEMSLELRRGKLDGVKTFII